MNRVASARVQIQNRTDIVFAYCANLENFSHWFPGVVNISALKPADRPVPEMVYMETIALPFAHTRDVQITVTETDGTNYLATEGDFPPLMPRMEIRVRDLGEGSCELSWQMFSRNEQFAFRHTLLPIFRWIMQRRADIAMQNLSCYLDPE